MEINHPVAIVAVALAILSFFGSTYVVVALNLGWRFGYWVTFTCFGALMVLMSLFWVQTALGPRGAEPRWIAVGAGRDGVDSVEVNGERFTSPGRYPGGGWQPADEKDPLFLENDALKSALSTCLATEEPKTDDERERLEERLEDMTVAARTEYDLCLEATETLPPAPDEIPKIDGQRVAVLPEATDIRFTTDGGTLLGTATVAVVTRDPRVADDPKTGKIIGTPFVMSAYRDPGSLRLPPYASTVIWSLYFGFHLWGLHRAERRKLSPVAA